MKLALLTIPALFLAVACTTDDDIGPNAPTGEDGLALITSTPTRVTGTYVDPSSGVRVGFDSARSGDALYLNVIGINGRELIHAETVGSEYHFRYLGGRLTMSVDKAWIDAVRAEPDTGGESMGEADALHWSGDMNVLDEMLTMPEARTLPFLSRALGARGITGAEYPGSLSLHKIARQSAEALAIDLAPIENQDTASDGLYCSRPTANDCYGMCGNGCNCWSWVCGDCCYHSGCAKHDTWCRQGQWYYCYNITAVIALFGC